MRWFAIGWACGYLDCCLVCGYLFGFLILLISICLWLYTVLLVVCLWLIVFWFCVIVLLCSLLFSFGLTGLVCYLNGAFILDCVAVCCFTCLLWLSYWWYSLGNSVVCLVVWIIFYAVFCDCSFFVVAWINVFDGYCVVCCLGGCLLIVGWTIWVDCFGCIMLCCLVLVFVLVIVLFNFACSGF